MDPTFLKGGSDRENEIRIEMVSESSKSETQSDKHSITPP